MLTTADNQIPEFFQAINHFKYPDSSVDVHFYYKNATALHYHDYYELILITKGQAKHLLNDQTNILEQTAIALIKPGETHQFTPYKGYKVEHLNISVTQQQFEKLCNVIEDSLFFKFNSAPYPLYSHLETAEFEHILFLTRKINSLQPDVFKKESTIFVNQILFNLITNLKRVLVAQKEFPDWFQEFLKKLDLPEYFTKPLTEIYPLSSYSQAQLNKFFHKYLGQTIISYVTQKKIHYACNLLQNTNYSILHISGMLSYESLAHFNRTFKKIIGVPPNAYRKTHNP